MDEQFQSAEFLRSVQLETLESLRILDRICKKYNIQYFLAYGTLLGAVRHSGFIPWDDDLDVGIMREDYEKLCKVPASEWGEDAIFLKGTDDDVTHDQIFARIYRKKSRIQSARDVRDWKIPQTGEAFYTRLMCDVFIYDYAPDDDAKYEKKRKKLRLLKNLYKYTKLSPILNGSVSKRVKTILKSLYVMRFRTGKAKPWVAITEEYERIATKTSKSKRICWYPSVATPMPVDMYFPLKTMRFEDMELPVPNDYDAVLKWTYGNYMEYPPENERTHIPFIYVDLGNGKKYILNPIPGSLGEKEKMET